MNSMLLSARVSLCYKSPYASLSLTSLLKLLPVKLNWCALKFTKVDKNKTIYSFIYATHKNVYNCV